MMRMHCQRRSLSEAHRDSWDFMELQALVLDHMTGLEIELRSLEEQWY